MTKHQDEKLTGYSWSKCGSIFLALRQPWAEKSESKKAYINSLTLRVKEEQICQNGD